MPRGKRSLVALAFLSIFAPSLSARAEEAMSYLSPNDVLSSETVMSGGQLQTFLNVAPPLPPGPNLVCRRIVIPIEVFIRPCSFFNYCPDGTGNGVVYIVRVRCRHINPPPQPPQLPRADTTGALFQTLRAGTFQVTDVSTLPNSVNTVVSFGIPAGARYGLPADFSGNCPRGTVLITSPALQGLGNKSVCVQTAATTNDSLLQTQATQRFASLVANPDNADTDLPSLRDLLVSVMGTLAAAAVCRTDDQGHIAMCLRNTGNVDLPDNLGVVVSGLCPVLPRIDLFNACVGRANQTPLGCGVIACVEALNDRGLAGCISALAQRSGAPLLPHVLLASTAACKLIARRTHFYTAPRNGSALEICQTTNAGCTQTSVVNTLLADVRRNAPYVLQGPPSGGVAASLLTTPMPIDQSNPSRLYYLGGYVQLGPDLLIPTNTSNPITATVGGALSCDVATNTANVDHLLVGTAAQCIFQEGTAIKSRVTGTGNGRFALLNELVGPIALGTAQQALRDAVQAQLPPPSGPRPPRPSCPRPPCPSQP